LCGFQADEGKVERARNDGMEKKQGRKGGGNERDKGRE
jgi:hypothetical protein